jgi:S1-C subfamily serine protease
MSDHRWAPQFEPPPPEADDSSERAPAGAVVTAWGPPPDGPRDDGPDDTKDWVVPPTAGWGDTGWGAGSAPPPPPPPVPPRPDRGPAALVVGIVVALIIGFLGGGLVLHRGTSSTSSSTFDTSRGATPLVPSPSTTPAPSTGASSTTLDLDAIAAKVDPAVVDITTRLGQSGSAAGTGMVLTADGQVLTNNHVIEGATSIRAQINGTGSSYTAKVLGTDRTDDVALLQLQGVSNLQTVSTVDSSTVSVGDQVVAIGNALGLGGTPAVSAGSVRALNQSVTAGDPSAGTAEDLTGMIQIDATLKPGDSGGPLVNAGGQVIGMNTAASVGGGRFRSSGAVGFAIPIDRALSIANEIRAGRASATIQIGEPGFLGVQVTTVAAAQNSGALQGSAYTPPVNAGAVVAGVVPDAAADKAGVAAGDVIVSVDGKTVDSPDALTPLLHAHHPGDTVQLGWVGRDGQRHNARVKLTTAPTG